MVKEKAAIILAAGKGTRMRSRLTKVLHPLLGRPLLAYPINACRGAGVENVVAVVGHGGEEVRAAFEGWGIRFANQNEQLGTAHAVLAAKEAVGEVEGIALILSGDVPLIRESTLLALLNAHKSSGRKVTLLSMVPDDPKGYGRLLYEGENLVGIVEERDASPEQRRLKEVNTGTYAVDLPWLWDALARVGCDNEQGEYYLTDIIGMAAKDGSAGAIKLEDNDEAMGVNDRVQLAEAQRLMRVRVNREHMLNGVTFEDPPSTWVEPSATIASDVTIGANVKLCGNTVIGVGAIIGQGSVISDSAIGRDVEVKPYSVVLEASIAGSAKIGPFAHLRPGAKVGEAARVGNFVEVKNSILHSGVKASHLTYLGDAEVGAGTNIGAGTITCNYDGVNKFKTKIGERAFIGSNSSLVAPVEIGAEATVGAGSTITSDVESGALGVSRAKQRTIPRWKRPVKRED
ncbi:MAG: UDP-N-acetylglucosamine diphosphorylase/glucosamine-1-phosphate N-acetyltransferase [Deltaproteobacteria bacterium]|nr:MAG: UDP-N-acetylglucosamine diphosphorylase/glucosamine-1-phosphate N-acetyltransferase [Deltaproteobacteria bacterium]